MSTGELDAISTFLDSFTLRESVFEIMSDNKKVKCLLTKHEIPCTIESIKQYTEGGKFKRLYKQLENQKGTKNSQDNENIKEGTGKVNLKYDKYKEFFVESKKSSSRMFCTLTKKEVNKLPHELEKYVQGYKFLKALHKRKEAIKNGTLVEDEQETVNEKAEKEVSNEKESAAEVQDEPAEEDEELAEGMWIPEHMEEDVEEEDMEIDDEKEDIDEEGEEEAEEDDNKENIVEEESEDIDKLACEDDIVESEHSKAVEKVETNNNKLIEDLKAIISNGELNVKRKRTKRKSKSRKSMDTSTNSVAEETPTPATPVIEKEETSDKKENSNKKRKRKKSLPANGMDTTTNSVAAPTPTTPVIKKEATPKKRLNSNKRRKLKRKQSLAANEL